MNLVYIRNPRHGTGTTIAVRLESTTPPCARATAGASVEGGALRLRAHGGGDQPASEHHDGDGREGPEHASRVGQEGAERNRREDGGDLADPLRNSESRCSILRREQFGRVWVHRTPGTQVEEAHKDEPEDESREVPCRCEDIAADPAKNEEQGERLLPAPFLHENHRRSVSGELRDGGDDEEQGKDIRVREGRDTEPLQGRREPEEQTVIAEVQCDPDANRDSCPTKEVPAEESPNRCARDRGLPCKIGRIDVFSGHSAKHAGGFLEPTLPRQVVWALRNREAEQERDEGGERSDKEEEAPRAIELDDEEVPEPNGEKEPARPEEVEEHHVATTVLRREVL